MLPVVSAENNAFFKYRYANHKKKLPHLIYHGWNNISAIVFLKFHY